MSRASAGSFAAFFPNAPSVLEKKRKRSSSQAAETSLKPSASEILSGPDRGDRISPPTTASESGPAAEQISPQLPSTREDDEIRSSESGDILNGVESASSLASTTSSIFSNPHQTHSSHSYNATLVAHALTPLTNTELSPPEKVSSPTQTKVTNGVTHMDRSPPTGAPAAAEFMNHVSHTITPAHTPPEIRQTAQPALGQVRGFKIHFDPETAEGLTREQRKKSKVKYRYFNMQEVCRPTPPLEQERLSQH